MNYEKFQLPEMEMERFQVKEVLRCLLHTILFNRALGSVRPKDLDCDVFDVSYVASDDVEISRGVDQSIENFLQAMIKETHQGKRTSGQIQLSFYKRVSKKTWFSTKEEKVYWERWVIPVAINTSRERHSTGRSSYKHSTQQQTLRTGMVYIVQSVNEKKDHIPPVPKSTGAAVFPFEISFSVDKGDDSWGLGNIKKIIQDGPPALLG